MLSTATAMELPNLYTLHGERITVTYAVTSFAGGPHLTFQDFYGIQQFAGTDLQVETCALGTVVTVSIAKTVDRGATTFSLTLPSVNLRGDRLPTLNTFGVVSRHHTSIIGPPPLGQTTTYHVAALHGTAEQVQF